MGCEETTWEGEVFGVSQGEKRGEWQRPLTSKLSRIGVTCMAVTCMAVTLMAHLEVVEAHTKSAEYGIAELLELTYRREDGAHGCEGGSVKRACMGVKRESVPK